VLRCRLAAGEDATIRVTSLAVIPKDAEKTRRGYQRLTAVNPDDGKPFDVFVSDQFIDRVARQGWARVQDLAFNVPEILNAPAAIFRGVRDRHDHWLCYSGIPRVAYTNDRGVTRPPWTSEVLVVFLNDERVLYAFRWENADAVDSRLPENHETRFGIRAL
jgi:hypothetical protein